MPAGVTELPSEVAALAKLIVDDGKPAVAETLKEAGVASSQTEKLAASRETGAIAGIAG